MRNKWNRLVSGATRLARPRPFVEVTKIVQKSLAEALDRSAALSAAAVVPRPFDAFLRWPTDEKRRPPVAQAASRAQHDEVGTVSGVHAFGGLTRHYKLFVPASAEGSPPLIVMLHGCTQNADDFAAGTRMNRAAEAAGFLVLYPEQSRDANPSCCWNWFGPQEQTGGGEAAFLRDLTRTVVDARGADPHRVYVAGLSAGGAMAALVAAGDPSLFAAVAVHSGLPVGAARNVPDALMAMRNGARKAAHDRTRPGVPMIVFHGDQDHTVHPDNAERLIESVVGDAVHSERQSSSPDGAASGFTRTEYVGADGAVLAESWMLHGAGHAWAGGDASGSHTDPAGIDATGEMLRFFESHPR